MKLSISILRQYTEELELRGLLSEDQKIDQLLTSKVRQLKSMFWMSLKSI